MRNALSGTHRRVEARKEPADHPFHVVLEKMGIHLDASRVARVHAIEGEGACVPDVHLVTRSINTPPEFVYFRFGELV